MIRAHLPGSQPIDIPEVIPNPAVVPKQEPAPKEPAPKNPVKVPEKVPAGYAPNAGAVGHGNPCGSVVAWSKFVPQMTFAVRFHSLAV